MKDINSICQFFENLNEYVYVTDIETYDIVYMNKKVLAAYGINCIDDVKGKKCYEILQNSSLPCSMCNNMSLCEGKFDEWNHYNSYLNKYLIIKDTMITDSDNGKRYRIEIAVDISHDKEHNVVVQKRQNMEIIVNEGLRIALRAPTPDKSIEVILEYLGNLLQGERTYIFERNERGEDNNTYEWVAKGVKPEKDNLQNLPPELCANWYERFREGRNIIYRDLEEIRENDPLQYDNLKRQNIHSLVVIPLYDDGKVIAFYGVDNPPLMKLEYTSDILQIMGHFLVSCLRRRNLMYQLEDMSYKDQLTKIGNRFAVDKYLSNVNRDEAIGVIYCDITGLKIVNDTKGHEEGDKLIITACKCLQKAFDGYGVFRIGGDEILALCAGIKEDILLQRVNILKKYSKKENINIAIGQVWKDKFDCGLDELLQESETKMYIDKDKYYKEHKVERRK